MADAQGHNLSILPRALPRYYHSYGRLAPAVLRLLRADPDVVECEVAGPVGFDGCFLSGEPDGHDY